MRITVSMTQWICLIQAATHYSFMDTPNNPDTNTDTQRLRMAFVVALSFASFLWVVKFVEFMGGVDFTHLGIYPRRLGGLVGVLTSPFICKHRVFQKSRANNSSEYPSGVVIPQPVHRTFHPA